MGERQRAREQLGIGRDALVFSSVGNLFSYKGHADLLAALDLANADLPTGWRLLVVGRDNNGYLAEREEIRDRYGLTDNIRFLGQRSDVPVILCAADIHLTASHTEGFPNNILEAMCAGRPVIATAVGGIPELVVDGETGVLVPSKDPAAMARAMVGLAADPARIEAMGTSGHARVCQSFSVERSVAAFETIYAG
jgi:glycosyltransferase involved in cell wall biosynthesis